jgi:hypothetical protein
VPAVTATAVADLLDLDLASDRAPGRLEHADGEAVAVPGAVSVIAPGAPLTWWRVPSLRCDGVPVRFWVTDDDAVVAVVAVDDGAAGCGLAQAGGVWPLRATLAALLSTADPAALLAAELPGLP